MFLFGIKLVLGEAFVLKAQQEISLKVVFTSLSAECDGFLFSKSVFNFHFQETYKSRCLFFIIFIHFFHLCDLHVTLKIHLPHVFIFFLKIYILATSGSFLRHLLIFPRFFFIFVFSFN